MSQSAETPPLWYVDQGRALFAGPLGRNASHRHSVPVLLAGLYGRFALRIDGAEWLNTRMAVIPAGLAYAFDMKGEPLAVLYLEPSTARAENLTRLLHGAREVRGALVAGRGEIAVLRQIYEDRDSPLWIRRGLDDLMGFAGRNAEPFDLRIARVCEAMQEDHRDLRHVQIAAARTGLSPSRFQHVFTKEVGVPFRRYRAWCRMRAAIRAVVEGDNLTGAAHAAGFADQAHFARDFRRTFGAPATPSLAKVRIAPKCRRGKPGATALSNGRGPGD